MQMYEWEFVFEILTPTGEEMGAMPVVEATTARCRIELPQNDFDRAYEIGQSLRDFYAFHANKGWRVSLTGIILVGVVMR